MKVATGGFKPFHNMWQSWNPFNVFCTLVLPSTRFVNTPPLERSNLPRRGKAYRDYLTWMQASWLAKPHYYFVFEALDFCDRKSRAAYAQSFALWQQAIIEIMFAISLLLLLARDTYIMVLVNYTFNATPPERLQQHPLLFTKNRTDRTFFGWRLNSARPSHPGYSTILMRSEIPSGIFAKFCTVAASNNRDHARNLSYYCLLALHI